MDSGPLLEVTKAILSARACGGCMLSSGNCLQRAQLHLTLHNDTEILLNTRFIGCYHYNKELDCSWCHNSEATVPPYWDTCSHSCICCLNRKII